MPLQTRLPLSELRGWLQAHDDHAPHRMPILEQARQILEGETHASAEERSALAVKLERWRYQHLNEQSANFSPPDWRLVDTLDLAANELAGRPRRLARGVYAAIHLSGADTVASADALAALDRDVPLVELARRSREITAEHFSVTVSPPGRPIVSQRRILMYAPLYLANQCVNHCLYCGFRYPLEIARKQLSCPEAVGQAEILLGHGFHHMLLVAGDFPSQTTTAYYVEVLQAMRDRRVRPSIEIAAQATDSYAVMVAAGACGLTLYQETYDESLYRLYHVRGPKTSYFWRLEAMDRAAEAGMPRLALGVLLGLGDPKQEFRSLLRHGRYLAERFPNVTLAFGLPRLHETPAGFNIAYPIDDDTLCRMYCALRMAFPRAELVLSTREPPALRNWLAKTCITQLSAGSSTAPGGYGQNAPAAGEQFAISDHRSPEEVAVWLASEGIVPCWDLSADRTG